MEVYMLTKREEIQTEMMMFTMEDLVPEESLYRKIDKYIDFTFIYDEVKDLYSDTGRPSVDPVVLFKLVFIQAIDGIKSMRRTCAKIKVDAEYRWFLKIPFGHDTPHFSVFSKNYQRRFKDNDIFEKIFINIVNQAIEYGLVDGTKFFTDSTHKKANANKKLYDEEIVEEVKVRRKWLEAEINAERRAQGKSEFEYKDEVVTKKVKVSRTDSCSGYYFRDHKDNGFMYLDHRTVDAKCNIIVDCYITKGNVHDSMPYIERMEYLRKTFGFIIKQVALDSGYLTIDIKKYLLDNNIFGVFGYRRYGTKESRKYKKQFSYLNELDIYYHLKTGEVLEYKGLINRDGYKTYTNEGKEKKLLRHIKEDLNELFRENKLSTYGKELYKQRAITVERSFADSKCNHGYRYAMYRGLKKNQHYTWLICAAQNMKNIALKVSKYDNSFSNTAFLELISLKIGEFYQILKISSKPKPLAFSY